MDTSIYGAITTVLVFIIAIVLSIIAIISKKSEKVFENIAFGAVLFGVFAYMFHVYLTYDAWKIFKGLNTMGIFLKVVKHPSTYSVFATFATLLGLLGFLDQSRKAKKSTEETQVILQRMCQDLSTLKNISGVSSSTSVMDKKVETQPSKGRKINLMKMIYSKRIKKLRSNNVMLKEQVNKQGQYILDYEYQLDELQQQLKELKKPNYGITLD